MSRTSLGLITSGVLNGGAKKALHWITSGLIRIGVVKVAAGGYVIIGRPVDHSDIIGDAAYETLVGAPTNSAAISGTTMLTEFAGFVPNVVLVGNPTDEPIYTLTGRPVAELIISAENVELVLIGSPTDAIELAGDPNVVELD